MNRVFGITKGEEHDAFIAFPLGGIGNYMVYLGILLGKCNSGSHRQHQNIRENAMNCGIVNHKAEVSTINVYGLL